MEMNAQRREALNTLNATMVNIIENIATLRHKELTAYYNISEGLQDSESDQQLKRTLDSLDLAKRAMESAVVFLWAQAIKANAVEEWNELTHELEANGLTYASRIASSVSYKLSTLNDAAYIIAHYKFLAIRCNPQFTENDNNNILAWHGFRLPYRHFVFSKYGLNIDGGNILFQAMQDAAELRI